MPSIKLLVLMAALATTVLSTPLPADEGHEEEEDHGTFLFNDSNAAADLASAAKNATVELSNDTMASNATGANATATLAPDHLERSENGTIKLVGADPSMANGSSSSSISSSNATVMAPTEERKEDAVEEAEEATKDLAATENHSSSKLLNQTGTSEEDPAPLEGDEKTMSEEADPKAMTTGTSGESREKMTTEKAVAGLKDDEGAAAVPLTTPAVPLTLSAHPMEKEEEASAEPSALQMHPVLRRNRTIQFRSGEADEWKPYADDMAAFLKPYSKEAQEHNVHCDFEKALQPEQACRFDLVYLGPSCTEDNHFGYGIGKPCVLLTPGHFAEWVPSPYDNDTAAEVPDEVQRLMRIFNANFMFVTCEGESESDRANIGPMAYLPPYQGFPSYFFPDKRDTVPSYVAPLMAIEFLNPTNGTLINVVCKAWAKNVAELPHPATLRFSLQVN